MSIFQLLRPTNPADLPLYLGFIGFAVLSSPLIASHRLPFHYTVGYCLLAGTGSVWCVVLPIPLSVPYGPYRSKNSLSCVACRFAKSVASANDGIAIGVLAVAAHPGTTRCLGGILDGIQIQHFHSTRSNRDGVLLAIFGNRMPILLRWQRVAFLLTSFGSFIVVYTLCFSSTWRLTLGYPVTAWQVPPSWSLYSAQHLSSGKSNPPPGKISYGLYVFHAFGLSCASHLFPTLRPVGILVQSGLGLR